jgi:AcrR family transcriptional regulator
VGADPTPLSPARRRTREAIVEAAVRSWARDRDASLADIARAAETHRATLHRHFASRAELLDAAVRRCVDEVAAATQAAVATDGTPIETLRRLVAAYLAIGDRVRFLFEDPAISRHPAVDALTADAGPVLGVIERAQAERALDPDLLPAWIERSIWALVYAASEAVDDGTLPAHDALPTLLRTIESGIGVTQRQRRR